MVNNLPATQKMQVRSLAWEDRLQKEMGTRSSVPAWEVPGKEETGRPQSMGSQQWDTT